jgi:anaerobic dimethyl sulfoxide reductase subunit A
VETDDGPEPQYRACLKGRAYRQLVYHPDRLKYPLRRVGERGEGKFERISWDEALDTIASELKRVKATYGARSTILLCSAGDLAYLHYGGLIDRLLVRVGGYTGVHGTVSNKGTEYAAVATYGVPDAITANSRDNLLRSRLIVFWGWNPVVTRMYGGHMPSVMSQLKETGARIISVDPRYTETASLLNAQWIPIRPGTDAAMLIAMAHVMITENLQDHAFLDKYTVGFDQFKDYVLGKEDGVPKTPSWAEAITGVPAATIASLAREYATTKPAAIMDGFAIARTAYGEQVCRAAATLAAMTGNIGIAGGSAGCGPMLAVDFSMRIFPLSGVHLLMPGGSNPVDLASPLRGDSVLYQRQKRMPSFSIPAPGHYYIGGESTAYLNRPLVADAILRGRSGGYPDDYKLLYLVTINWVNQYGNSNKIMKALKELEFVVVHEQFMTATAKFADIVLPQNTIFELNDMTGAPMLPFYGHREQAISSLGESKSMFEIATGLADKLGIAGFSDKTEEEWLREGAKSFGIPDYDTFKKEGIHRITPQPFVAFKEQIDDPENNPFFTPSGRIEIYCQGLADLENPMIPPIPKYIETWESRNDPLAKKYPLQLITTHYWRRTHSRFDNVPWTKELEAQSVFMNGADAQARGIKDGDMVRVFNDRGQTILTACVTEKMMPGVVDIPEGAWYAPDENGVDRGGCPNVLLNDVPSPGGALCTNTVLVQVEKA